MKNCPVLPLHLAVLLAGAALSACATSSEPIHGTDSSTHWLLSCTDDDQCGEFSCECGVCTEACDADDQCAALPGAECVVVEGCGGGAPASVCTVVCEEHGDCGDGQRCQSGRCVGASAEGTASNVPQEFGPSEPHPEGFPRPQRIEDPTFELTPQPDTPQQDTPASPPGPNGPTGPDRGIICSDDFTDPRVESAGCSDGDMGFVLPGDGAVATQAEQLAVLDALRDTLHGDLGAVGSGFGLCCNGDFPGSALECINVTFPECDPDLPELIGQLTAKQAELGLADKKLQLVVELPAPRSQRCPDGTCGPQPYQEHDGEPPAERTPVPGFGPMGPACTDDGQCQISGCGNVCSHWTEAPLPSTCPAYPELADAFCGCVQDQCGWFE